MKTIFIDRDGVINKDPGGWTVHSYVTQWKDFHFLPGALEALKILQKNGIRVIVISNQAGVNKGYFSKKALQEVNDRMVEAVAKYGGKIEDAYYCVHRDEDNCNCRKPKTGLFKTAAREHDIDLKNTYFVGDSLVDIVAGKAIGSKTIFVLSGKTVAGQMKRWAEKPDYVFNDLLEAVNWLVRKEKIRARRALRRERREY